MIRHVTYSIIGAAGAVIVYGVLAEERIRRQAIRLARRHGAWPR